MKSPKLLRKTLYRTKHLVQKTLNNLKSFVLGEYEKLPKAPAFHPFFSAGDSSRKMQDLDDFYRVFSEQLDELQKGKKEDAVSPEVLVSEEDGECSRPKEQAEAKKVQINIGNEKEKGSSKVLAHKMKEFDMFEVDDVDHQLDIEEVLHYYSRLTSPVFVDIVDNFFMDMYSEFVLPEPSVSVNSSMRRLGPLKLSPCVS